MRIGEVATLAGVSVRSLRYYEQQGLLAAERSRSGQRLYGADAVGRVRFIQLMYGAGLPSRSVAEILPCLHTGRTTPQMRERLVAERDRIDGQIAELTATRERLDDVIAAADGAACCVAGPAA